MRIIFRATGPFTHQLAHSLKSGVKLPCIRIDGFHGTPHRANQVLKHDVAALVAGGIGITPYLSLLHEVVSVMASRQPPMRCAVTKEVVLHWVCRDQALLEYVKAQYFDPLHWNPSKEGCRIRIIVHNTRRKLAVNSLSSAPEMAQELTILTDNDGVPFTPSRFSSGKTTSMFGNFFPFVTFATTAWVGLWVTWRLYMTVTSDHEIVGRVWAVLAIVAIAVVVALLANFAARVFDRVPARPLDLALLEKPNEHGDVGMESGEEGFAKQPLVAMLNNNAKADSNLSMVTYEEKVGRPTVHALLECLDGVRCPGLFVCGPKQLTQDLRDAADERCQIRIRHSIRGTPRIAIYEEMFEL
jgi:ferredoxin-NADP reductase